MLYPWPYNDLSNKSWGFVKQSPNHNDFDFITTDESKQKIYFNSKKCLLNKNLIIPAGYELICDEGTNIILGKGKNILSYSPLIFEGTEAEPIRIEGQEDSGSGIIVMNSKKMSVFNYVIFSNLSKPKDPRWGLTSSITLYESPAELKHCTFDRNYIADDFINFIRTSFKIDSSNFMNVNADAIDGDFTNGEIYNTEFYNIGNDAIDISGSELRFKNITIDFVGDKALSAGEKSFIYGKNINISNSEIGVTSKDLSLVEIKNITINDGNIGYCAFQKKT